MVKKKKTSAKEKSVKAKKEKKIRVKKVGIHRKSVVFLWILLIGSVSFGIYKNFTAIDIHTVHEKEVIKQNVIDTNGLESYVKNFAKVYHSWANNKESLENRSAVLKNYFTEELQQLNTEAIRSDVSTSSTVSDVQIWDVIKTADNEYTVTYAVNQVIVEGEQQNSIESAYETVIHADNNGDMIVIKNPTVCSVPGKSDYQPKQQENDINVTAKEREEITEFLNTFFKLYPTAEEKELAYYVKGEALKTIGGHEEYIFSKISNATFQKAEEGIEVKITVEYLDQLQKITQLAQYDLILEKEDNWLIVKSK